MIDIVIKNGRVIDYYNGTDQVMNLAVKDGLFCMYDDNEDVKKTIDAEGCIVTPGFIDSHMHAHYWGTGGLSNKADISCLPNGVTSCVDAGSTGILGFESFYRTEIVNSLTSIYAMLHPCSVGVQLPPMEEIEDPKGFNVNEILRLFAKYPDVLKGLKIRMSKGTASGFGMAPIYKSEEISEMIKETGQHCLVMCHFSDLADDVTMDEFVNAFKKGDVIAHPYHPAGGSIFDPDGKILDSVYEARDRGVYFDSARARINFSLSNIIKAANQGFYPDMMGTDLAKYSLYWKPSYSIIWSMSMFLNVGMPLKDIYKSVTYTPALAMGILDKAGKIEIGKPADITITKVVDKKLRFADLFGTEIVGEKIIVPMATVKDGRVVFQQIFMDDELS